MQILRILRLGCAIATLSCATVLSGIGIGSFNHAFGQVSQTCEIQRGRSSSLTCANIYEIISEVQVIPFNRSSITLTTGETAVLFQDDRLRTLWGSRAELQFNEGSLVWSNPDTVFEFTPGLRRIDLSSGAILVVTEPGAPPVDVRTAELRTDPRGTAYVVQRNDVAAQTEVFALTDHPDGPLEIISTQADQPSIELNSGELVRATREGFNPVEEFDLQLFYMNNSLVAGLGPNQEATVAQKPPTVQVTLNAVRIETLAAVREQNRGFGLFLPTALTGADSGFRRDIEQVERRNEIDSLGAPIDGTFTRTTDNPNGIDDGTFVTNDGQTIPITLDFDERQITIGGVDGRSSTYGLRGDRAFGAIILEDDGAIFDASGESVIEVNSGNTLQVEIFGVDGREPSVGEPFSGRLIQGGIIPDR